MNVISRRWYNTVRLTKGQRRQRKKHLIQKAKERATLEADKAFRGRGNKMSIIYQEAHHSMKTFLYEIEHDFKHLHSATTSFVDNLIKAKEVSNSVHDVVEYEKMLAQSEATPTDEQLDIHDYVQSAQFSSVDPIGLILAGDSGHQLLKGFNGKLEVYKENLESFKNDINAVYMSQEERNEMLNDMLVQLARMVRTEKPVVKSELTQRMLTFVLENKRYEEQIPLSKKEKKLNHRGAFMLKAHYPDATALYTMLRTLRAQDRCEDALKLYEEFVNNFNIEIDLQLCHMLVTLYSTTGNINRALKYYSIGKEIIANTEIGLITDEKEFSKFISNAFRLYCCSIRASSSSIYHALTGQEIFDQMVLTGIQPERFAYLHLISCYATIGDVDNAVKVLNSVPDKYKTVHHYVRVYKAIAKSQVNVRRKLKSVTRDYDMIKDLKDLMTTSPQEIKNEDQALAVALNVDEKDGELPFGGHVYDAVAPSEYQLLEELDPFNRLLRSSTNPNDYRNVLEHRMKQLGVNLSRGRMDMLSLENKEEVTERNTLLIEKLNSELEEIKVYSRNRPLIARHIAVTYGNMESDELLLKYIEDMNNFTKVPLGVITELAQHYMRRNDIEKSVEVSNSILQNYDFQNMNKHVVGIMAESFARLGTEEGFNQCFKIIDQYSKKNKGDLLMEKHYQAIRYLYRETDIDIDLFNKVIPPDPNAWKSRKVVAGALAKAKEHKDISKQAKILTAHAQRE